MKRVITVNLGGNAYQLDEDAYVLLHTRLTKIERRLELHPRREEKLADFERALSERCQTLVSPTKTIITNAELGPTIDEISALHGFESGNEAQSDTSDDSSIVHDNTERRRLFQVRDGAVISGICKGLSEYFGINVVAIRAGFVLLALLTSGGWAVFYLALMFIIPFDPDRPPSMETGIPARSYEVVTKIKNHFGIHATR